MNAPNIGLLIWPIISMSILILLIYAIIKFVRKRPVPSRAVVPIVAVLFFASCSKKDNLPISVPVAKSVVAEQLGFDPATITYISAGAATNIIPLRFNNLEEAKKYFKKVQPGMRIAFKDTVYRKYATQFPTKNTSKVDPDQEQPIDYTLPGQDHSVIMRSYLLWTGRAITFNYSFGTNMSGGGSYGVSGISSTITGMTIGVGWEQKNATYVNYPGSSLIYITVIGIQTYNIFIESIGTLFTQVAVIDGVYNVNTGEYTMTTH